jgi:hypothetical protein
VKLTLNGNFQPARIKPNALLPLFFARLPFDLSRALVVICLARANARLVTALVHLFPIDGTEPQDNGTIQYKKLLKLTVLA